MIKEGSVTLSNRYLEDWQWFHDGKNYIELYKKYKNMWVAVKDKKVIASGKDLSKVIETTYSESGGDDILYMLVDEGDYIYGIR